MLRAYLNFGHSLAVQRRWRVNLSTNENCLLYLNDDFKSLSRYYPLPILLFSSVKMSAYGLLKFFSDPC